MQVDMKHMLNKVFILSPDHASTSSIEVTSDVQPNMKVHLMHTTRDSKQLFTLVPLQNGNYGIKSIANQHFLNFTGQGNEVITGIFSQMSEWQLVPMPDGGYMIKYAYQPFYIDISGASKSNGAKVITWTQNNKDNQKYRLTVISELQAQVEVVEAIQNQHMHNHVYILSPEHAPDKAVDLAHPEPNSHVHLWTIHRQSNQQWKLVPLQSGHVALQNMQSGMFMNAHGKGKYIDAGMQGPESEWRMVRFPEGGFMIESVPNKMVLDCSGAGKVNGTKIELWAANDNKNQKFMFTEVM